MIFNPAVISQITKESLSPISKIRVFDTKNIDSYFRTLKTINPLLNPSFENWVAGEPTDWNFSGSSTGLNNYEIKRSPESVHGSYSLFLKERTITWDEALLSWNEIVPYTWDYFGDVTAYAYQDVSHQGGAFIHFGASIKGDGYIGVRFFDSNNCMIEDSFYGFNFAQFTDFRQSSSVPENTAYIRLIAGFENPQTGFILDKVFVSEDEGFVFNSDVSISAYDEVIPISVSGMREIDKNSTFEFSLPKENRFTYSNGKYGILDKYNIIEIFVGYFDRQREMDYYQKVFVGFILNVSDSGLDNLSVTCIDFSEKFKSTLNFGYPDYHSYLDMPIDSGFLLSRDEIKKDKFPMCYDNWLVENVIRDLCIKSGFPLSFTKIFPTNIRLSVGSDSYPYTRVDGNDTALYQFSMKDDLWGIIQEIASEFGYQVGFSHEGIFTFQPTGQWEIHVPDEIVTDNNFELIKNQYSVDNPTWRYVTNESNQGVGEFYIPLVTGNNMRLYTIGDKSNGEINVKIFYLDDDDSPVEEDLGNFNIKGTTDDGSAFLSNYVDIFANEVKYIGGAIIAEVVSGYVAIAGYGFNSDELSSPQFDFTSVSDITNRSLEISAEDIRNEVLVIGESRTGKDIAVRAIDEWSIYGGRKLGMSDFSLSSSNTSPNLNILFNDATDETISFNKGDTMSLSFNSSQMLTEMGIDLDMGFGSKVKYSVKDENGDTIYSSLKINDSSEGRARVIDDDSSYNNGFYLGIVAGIVPFVATDYEIYFFNNGEKKKLRIEDPNVKKIIDVSEIGDYLFIMTDTKVYRYNFLIDSLEEFSSMTTLTSPPVYLIAHTAAKAVIMTKDETFRTNFGSEVEKYINFILPSGTFMDVKTKLQNAKPVILNDTLFTPVKKSDYGRYSGRSFLNSLTLDLSNIVNNCSISNSDSFRVVSSFKFYAAKKNETFLVISGGERVRNLIYIMPNPSDSETWETRILSKAISYDQVYYYDLNGKSMLYGIEGAKWYAYKFTRLRSKRLFNPNMAEIDNNFNIILDSGQVHNRILSTSLIASSKVDIFVEKNGLYSSYVNMDFDDGNHGSFIIPIERPISKLVFSFDDAFGEDTINVSEISIYSRSIMSVKDILPSNKYNFDTKSRPLFGSWDSLVGNTSDKTLPFYNYQTADLPPNFIGMKKTFIYKDGRLNNEAVCSWMAQHLLHRYRKNFFSYEVEVIGNPLIELYDCVRFIDSEKGLDLSEYFWIEGIRYNWGKTASVKLNVSKLKPLNSYQNFIDLYRQSDEIISGVIPAVIHKDTPVQTSFLENGSFVTSGINESTFVKDSGYIIIDPFFNNIGFKMNVNKNCKITLKVYDYSNNLQKVVNYDEFKSGDIFENYVDLPFYDMTSRMVWNDFGDFPLFLKNGDYTLNIEVTGTNNFSQEKKVFRIPFTSEADYNFRTTVSSAKFDPIKGNTTVITSTEKKLVGDPDIDSNWTELTIDRVVTLFRSFIYAIDNSEKKQPFILQEIEWTNNGAIIKMDFSGVVVSAGYKPVIVLGAIKDRMERFAGSSGENFTEMTVEEAFAGVLPPDAAPIQWKNGHTDHLKLHNRYKKKWNSSRVFNPIDLETGESEPLNFKILDLGGVEKVNGTYNTSLSGMLSFNGGRIGFEPYGTNYCGMRMGAWDSAAPDILDRFNSIKNWKIEVTELKFFTNIEGWE